MHFRISVCILKGATLTLSNARARCIHLYGRGGRGDPANHLVGLALANARRLPGCSSNPNSFAFLRTSSTSLHSRLAAGVGTPASPKRAYGLR